MRSLVVRQRMVRVAAVAASVVLVASACGTKPGGTSNDPGSNGGGSLGTLNLTEGTLLVSDGTNVVTVGDQKVTFPTKVTDAAWSPDGSRVAFVDGDGNIATARPDGTGMLVLTRTDSGAVRSRPSWSRAVLFYAEKKADGTSALKAVPINGCSTDGQRTTGDDWQMDTGDGTSYVDLSPSAALNERPSSVVFQHNEPSGPEVWINDTNRRSPYTVKLVDGSEPALRTDGAKLAYVSRDGQIYVRDAKPDATSVQITFGADHPGHLVWTPDGQHVAYETPSGVESVSISPGSGANPATKLSTTTGVPTFLTSTKDTVSRVSGADPVALSIAASQAQYPGKSRFVLSQGYIGASRAVISTPQQAPSFKGFLYLGGPLLLTAGDSLDPRTKAELQRIFGSVQAQTGGTPEIDVYGDAVSAGVVSALEAMSYHVTRSPAPTEPTPNPAPAADCGPAGAGLLFPQTLVVVDAGSAMDNAIATAMFAGYVGSIVRIDAKAGLTDQLKTYLERTSAAFNNILIVDGANTFPADLEKQIGTVLSGPLGYTAGTNPTLPPLN